MVCRTQPSAGSMEIGGTGMPQHAGSGAKGPLIINSALSSGHWYPSANNTLGGAPNGNASSPLRGCCLVGCRDRIPGRGTFNNRTHAATMASGIPFISFPRRNFPRRNPTVGRGAHTQCGITCGRCHGHCHCHCTQGRGLQSGVTGVGIEGGLGGGANASSPPVLDAAGWDGPSRWEAMGWEVQCSRRESVQLCF